MEPRTSVIIPTEESAAEAKAMAVAGWGSPKWACLRHPLYLKNEAPMELL